MEWNTGLDYWSATPTNWLHILGHAHNTKSFQAKDCTKCMSQGSLAV